MALLPLVAAACGSGQGAPKVGMAYTTGGDALLRFFQAEVDRARAEGAPAVRIVGFEEDPAGADDSPLAAEVRRAERFVADPDVLVAIGPGGSREVLQVAPIFREAGMMQIVPTATSRALRQAGDHTFLLSPDDSLQGVFLGAFADTALGARRAAIFYVPDEYGIGLASGTAAALAARGVRLLGRTPVGATNDCGTPAGRLRFRDFAEELALGGRPDVIVLAMRTVQSGCLAAALVARFPDVGLLAGDGTYLGEPFFARAGAAASSTYVVHFWDPGGPDERSRRFAAAFEAAVGRTVRHGDAMFHDALMLAVQAIREAGQDRAAVRRYLTEVGRSRPAFDGITGPIGHGAHQKRRMLMLRASERRGAGTRAEATR
ncbi:MAG: ABC transporter substrate-binding protein [Gemmatimonadetes bacterium]|nr:ABC transporter substrate-binding protein [Gemmatimonadota bacterium]